MLQICSSLAAFSSETPGELTLEQAISEGLQNSPDIQKSEAALNESTWKKCETIGAGFLPKIAVSAAHFFDLTKYQLTDLYFGNNEVMIPGVFPNNQIIVNATLPLFDGLSNLYRAQAASLSENASEQELERKKFVLGEQIRLTFLQVLGASALKEAAEENVKTLQDHLKLNEIQRSGGTATQYDTLRIQVQYSEAKSAAEDAEDRILESRQRLLELLGYREDVRTLKGDLPVPDRSQIENLSLNEEVPPERTDLRALNLRSESAEQTKKAQNSWFIPTLSAGGQFTYYNLLLYNNGVTDNHNYQTAYHLGLFLTWSLFDGGVSYSRTQEAAAQQIQAEKISESARIQVPHDFAFWKKRFLTNTDHFRSKQLDVTRSQESVRLAKEEERAGTRISSEVLDAELDLFRSRAGVVNAQLNAIESLINLELALGRRI